VQYSTIQCSTVHYSTVIINRRTYMCGRVSRFVCTFLLLLLYDVVQDTTATSTPRTLLRTYGPSIREGPACKDAGVALREIFLGLGELRSPLQSLNQRLGCQGGTSTRGAAGSFIFVAGYGHVNCRRKEGKKCFTPGPPSRGMNCRSKSGRTYSTVTHRGPIGKILAPLCCTRGVTASRSFATGNGSSAPSRALVLYTRSCALAFCRGRTQGPLAGSWPCCRQHRCSGHAG